MKEKYGRDPIKDAAPVGQVNDRPRAEVVIEDGYKYKPVNVELGRLNVAKAVMLPDGQRIPENPIEDVHAATSNG